MRQALKFYDLAGEEQETVDREVQKAQIDHIQRELAKIREDIAAQNALLLGAIFRG